MSISDERLQQLIAMAEESYRIFPDGEQVRLIEENERDTLEALYELKDARRKIELLKEDAERLADKVEWHSKHHEFIENCYEDILFYHEQVMREVDDRQVVKAAIDKTLNENTGAWKKLAEE